MAVRVVSKRYVPVAAVILTAAGLLVSLVRGGAAARAKTVRILASCNFDDQCECLRWHSPHGLAGCCQGARRARPPW